MSPDDPQLMDETVFGSWVDARWAEVGATVDSLVDIARKTLHGGRTPAETAVQIEHILSRAPDTGDGRGIVALSHVLVRLATLPEPVPAKTIRQWVVTDPLGLPHVFENELLALRAWLDAPYSNGQVAGLTTPDGGHYTLVREWR
jgi:hypothetical protein